MKKLQQLLLPHIHQILEQPLKAETPETEKAKILLHNNESPYNTPNNRFPEKRASRLYEALSRQRKIRQDCIFATEGLDHLFSLFLHLFCAPSLDNIVVAAPSSPLISDQAAWHNIICRPINVGEQFQLSAIDVLAACDEHTKLIYLCSPSDISGLCLDPKEIVKLLAQFEGIVLIDESYIDFSSQNTLLAAIEEYSNAVIIQTFSHAWASAGLNLYVAYAVPELIQYLQLIAVPQCINTPTITQTLQILSRPVDAHKWTQQIIEERGRLIPALRLLPYCEKVYPSEANFILIRTTQAEQLYAYLKARGIKVLFLPQLFPQQDFLRITVGLPNENVALLGALRTYRS